MFLVKNTKLEISILKRSIKNINYFHSMSKILTANFHISFNKNTKNNLYLFSKKNLYNKKKDNIGKYFFNLIFR